MVRLGDYITEYSVKNKSNEDIPVYSVTNTQGFCTEYFSKDVSSKDKSNYKIVPRGCFAYNPSRINVGSVDWQRYEDRVIVSPLYNVFKVSPELENQYLYYFLKSDIGHTLITSKAEGSVRDNLKITMLAEFSIPLPPLETQKLIAAQLDKCTALIAKHKQMLEKYDTLIKSRFIEMFGDKPVESGKWKVEKLEDVCDLITDGTHKTPNYQQKGIRFISAKNIINGKIDLTDTKFITEEEYKQIQKRCRVEKNDVLLTKSGSLGSSAIIDFDIPIGLFESLAVIKYKRNLLNGIFVKELLSAESSQKQFNNGVKGIAIKHLHLNVIAALKIPIPPIKLQNDFAQFVQQIDKSKFEIANSLKRLYNKGMLS